MLDHPVVVSARERRGVVGIGQGGDRPVLLAEEDAVLDVVGVEMLLPHQLQIGPPGAPVAGPRVRPAAPVPAVRVTDPLAEPGAEEADALLVRPGEVGEQILRTGGLLVDITVDDRFRPLC